MAHVVPLQFNGGQAVQLVFSRVLLFHFERSNVFSVLLFDCRLQS